MTATTRSYVGPARDVLSNLGVEPMELICWGNTARLMNTSGLEYGPVTINGVPYSLWVELEQADGHWRLLQNDHGQDYRAISMSRIGNMAGASEAALKAVRTKIVPLVIAYLEANPAFVIDGHRRRMSEDVRLAEVDFARAVEAWDKTHEALASARKTEEDYRLASAIFGETVTATGRDV